MDTSSNTLRRLTLLGAVAALAAFAVPAGAHHGVDVWRSGLLPATGDPVPALHAEADGAPRPLRAVEVGHGAVDADASGDRLRPGVRRVRVPDLHRVPADPSRRAPASIAGWLHLGRCGHDSCLLDLPPPLLI